MALDHQAASLDPLPSVLKKGLVPVAFFGFLSFFCSTSLFLYLTYRLVSWKRYNRQHNTNQFVVLIYNLLFADIQQALAFLLNVNSLRRNGIFVGTSTCWAQGWFVSTGDLAGSVFISAIAIHTFCSVVLRFRIRKWCFYLWITCCWLFVYLLAIVGPLKYGDDFYTRAAAWCWINRKYDLERLLLHYLWMFILMFSTVIIYIIISVYLHHRKRNDPSYYVPPGARPVMLCYPIIYVICTIPLAAGRIATLAGRDVPLSYFCLAGAMIACNGWLDVLLYGLTRSDIVFSDAPPSEETGIETFGFWTYGGRHGQRGLGNLTTIEGGVDASGTKDGELRAAGASETSRLDLLRGRNRDFFDSSSRLPLRKLRGTIARCRRRSESVEKLYGPGTSRLGRAVGPRDDADGRHGDYDDISGEGDSAVSDSRSMRRAFGDDDPSGRFDLGDKADADGEHAAAGAGIGIQVKGEVTVQSREADEMELKQIAYMMTRHGRKASMGDLSSTKSVEFK